MQRLSKHTNWLRRSLKHTLVHAQWGMKPCKVTFQLFYSVGKHVEMQRHQRQHQPKKYSVRPTLGIVRTLRTVRSMKSIDTTCVKTFEKVVDERTRGADDKWQQFRALQIRAWDGNSNLEDWNMLFLRQLQNVVHTDNFPNSVVKISFGDEKVAKVS